MPLNDATGRMERVVESALARLETIQDKVLPSVTNRPLDSEPMSREQFLADYRMTRDDPVLLSQRLKEYQNQYLFKRGMEKWMSWIEDGEKG